MNEPNQYFEKTNNKELLNIARSLINEKEKDRSGNNKSCFFVNISGKDYALLTYECRENEKKGNLIRIKETNRLIEQGLHTPTIVDIEFDEDIVYELQEKANGKTLSYRNVEDAKSDEVYANDIFESLEILKTAPKSAFLELINDSKIFDENGHSLDCHSDNFVIDQNGYLTLIDLDLYREGVKRDTNYFSVVNTLPNIFSFFFIKPGMPHYDDCVTSMQTIAPVWIETTIDFLYQNGFSEEEVKKMVSNIELKYFHIDQGEKDFMMENVFNEINRKTGPIL